jgi:hypothetical protein
MDKKQDIIGKVRDYFDVIQLKKILYIKNIKVKKI